MRTIDSNEAHDRGRMIKKKPLIISDIKKEIHAVVVSCQYWLVLIISNKMTDLE